MIRKWSFYNFRLCRFEENCNLIFLHGQFNVYSSFCNKYLIPITVKPIIFFPFKVRINLNLIREWNSQIILLSSPSLLLDCSAFPNHILDMNLRIYRLTTTNLFVCDPDHKTKMALWMSFVVIGSEKKVLCRSIFLAPSFYVNIISNNKKCDKRNYYVKKARKKLYIKENDAHGGEEKTARPPIQIHKKWLMNVHLIGYVVALYIGQTL